MTTNKTTRTEAARNAISVWGVGDWGVKILGLVSPECRRRINAVAVNSDMQSLICSPVRNKIPLGKKSTQGLGSGGERDLAEKAFRESEEELRKKLAGSRTLIVVGGLGGGVGSSVIPALCRCAEEMGIFTLVLVTRPFKFEGKKKTALADAAREQLREIKVGLASFSLDRLLGKIDDESPCEEAFEYCDRILKEAIESVISYLTAPTPGGGDCAALGSIFTGEEAALALNGGSGPEQLVEAIKGAFSRLCLSAEELGRVKGVLVQIRAGGPVPFSQVRRAISSLAEMLSEEADLLYTIQQDKDLGEEVKVSLLVSGLPGESEEKPASAVPVTMSADYHPPKQAKIDFSRAARGRFDKTEPTVIDGEDLDIPTFIRKGVKIS